MENKKTPLILSSPRTSNNNGGFTIPYPTTRPDSINPYPTTFVQVDTSSFKQVVQMLTGSSETAKQASSSQTRTGNSTHHNIPPTKTNPRKTQTGFKLYERRKSLNHLKINPLNPVFSTQNSGFSLRKHEILSPSILDFPSVVLSPVTPLIPDPFDPNYLDAEAEEKAIKEKGFFLHPSPRDTQPRLLPLFPTTSPRASGSSSLAS
ncbi:hypothetical protein TanjilG_13097 [Lupinus angustifolius]|uniref:VQ domain-containing protein n=1 Tax=Lupinus angustifolius TaxID=3871 RepID=A0A1J7G6M1_LUPAN|nr:PREDICTED: VQ motif-containing protein 4-like [Lupinus angustifolius]OIV96165.1 hypothetical protein TanjilG_13097 [Lupinus angustifolius]